MRLLVDTHSLFWFVDGNQRLSSTARLSIADPNNDILVSPVSYWEIAIKISLGKWKLNRSYKEFVDIVFNQYEFRILEILPRHTEQLLKLPFHHRDPFDRLLVAQALTENIQLVSADEVLDAYGVLRIW